VVSRVQEKTSFSSTVKQTFLLLGSFSLLVRIRKHMRLYESFVIIFARCRALMCSMLRDPEVTRAAQRQAPMPSSLHYLIAQRPRGAVPTRCDRDDANDNHKVLALHHVVATSGSHKHSHKPQIYCKVSAKPPSSQLSPTNEGTMLSEVLSTDTRPLRQNNLISVHACFQSGVTSCD
jgi:hypothetical protein